MDTNPDFLPKSGNLKIVNGAPAFGLGGASETSPGVDDLLDGICVRSEELPAFQAEALRRAAKAAKAKDASNASNASNASRSAERQETTLELEPGKSPRPPRSTNGAPVEGHVVTKAPALSPKASLTVPGLRQRRAHRSLLVLGALGILAVGGVTFAVLSAFHAGVASPVAAARAPAEPVELASSTTAVSTTSALAERRANEVPEADAPARPAADTVTEEQRAALEALQAEARAQVAHAAEARTSTPSNSVTKPRAREVNANAAEPKSTSRKAHEGPNEAEAQPRSDISRSQ